MPIYEFACPKCRKIFNFLSKRIQPAHLPSCPKCGNKNLQKQMSSFAMPKGVGEEPASPETGDPADQLPDLDGPKMERFMHEMERDMDHLDENNPRHMAHMMKKMRDILPAASTKDMDIAIKRLESGEDPEKIEEDMGDVFRDLMGGSGDEEGGGGPSGGAYSRDAGLYDY
jgi:putative FmdB family regulatory protein